MHISTLSPQLKIDVLSILFHVSFVQATVIGCSSCDLIAQCIILVRIYQPLHPIIRFIHPNLQKRFTVVRSCGLKTSVS